MNSVITTELEDAAWHGSINDFMQISDSSLLSQLSSHHRICMLASPSGSQVEAWIAAIGTFRRAFAAAVAVRPQIENWELVLEYMLPRERGRRPDAVLLAGPDIVVLEFKSTSTATQAQVDQVRAYARDLANYHAASHDRKITPVLVLTGCSPLETCDETITIGAERLYDFLVSHKISSGAQLKSLGWVISDYAPLPSLVAAARTIFEHKPLPFIRRAHSVGIPETIESLISIAEQAETTRSLHLALVTGVPGAGKTLVGLQLVYATRFSDDGGRRTAVFLSGNGPLVEVLRYALESKVFVQDVHGFLKQYGGKSHRRPEEHIWVYDEAQRAWDSERVLEKRGHAASEPEDFLRIGEQMAGWAMMVGLVGEGQEIHLGEEAGIDQWNRALKAMPGHWTVHCPAKIADVFDAAAKIRIDEKLNLNSSLRSHVAPDVQDWIAALLAGNATQSSALAPTITQQGFQLYVCRDLDTAKKYVRERYSGALDKRYGLLASSKAKNVQHYGVQNGFEYTRRLRVGPWYNDDTMSTRSCCQMREVATEFSCQGLELDMPVIAWGDDFWWDADWKIKPSGRSAAKDPKRLRTNSYRVLLSRGRDGILVFVPPERNLDATYALLRQAGMTAL